MAYTFLGLTNRLCKALNEVELTSTTFASASGFYAEFKDDINRAIMDICLHKIYDWPFLHDTKTFNTADGTYEYTIDTDVMAADWTSFIISCDHLTISSITQSSGTATVTTSSSHNFETDDIVYIYGATPTGYNGHVTITVTSATEFTYSVDSALTSPATGTLKVIPPYKEAKLSFISWEKYCENDRIKDKQTLPENYSTPSRVTRKPNNDTLVLSPIPDRVYKVAYDAYIFPTPLSSHSDVPIIPAQFEQQIVDQALHHAYMFRDNMEQAQIAADRAKKGIEAMHRLLVPLNKSYRAG